MHPVEGAGYPKKVVVEPVGKAVKLYGWLRQLH